MADEVKAPNIYEKLQNARYGLSKIDIKKTGYNKHSNYYYYELSDFLPHIIEECHKNRLCTVFQFRKESAELIINDMDLDTHITFETPIEIAPLIKCTAMQSIGGTQTYAKKYLYQMAFEISETDSIDRGDVDQDRVEAIQKIGKAHIITINKLIDDTGTDKEKFLSWVGVKKVEDITNEAVGTCITELTKKRDKIEKELAVKKKNEDIDF